MSDEPKIYNMVFQEERGQRTHIEDIQVVQLADYAALSAKLAEAERERDGAFTAIRGLHGVIATAEARVAELEQVKERALEFKTVVEFEALNSQDVHTPKRLREAITAFEKELKDG